MRISDWSSDVCSSDLAVYCASGVVAGARLFESVFGLPYEQALWWGAVATIIYTLVGGFLAVSWTDTPQAGLMSFALLLAPSIILLNNGGLQATTNVVRAIDESRTAWLDVGADGLIRHVSAPDSAK